MLCFLCDPRRVRDFRGIDRPGSVHINSMLSLPRNKSLEHDFPTVRVWQNTRRWDTVSTVSTFRQLKGNKEANLLLRQPIDGLPAILLPGLIPSYLDLAEAIQFVQVLADQLLLPLPTIFDRETVA